MYWQGMFSFLFDIFVIVLISGLLPPNWSLMKSSDWAVGEGRELVKYALQFRRGKTTYKMKKCSWECIGEGELNSKEFLKREVLTLYWRNVFTCWTYFNSPLWMQRTFYNLFFLVILYSIIVEIWKLGSSQE